MIFSILLALGKIIKAIQTKMNMNIPIVPENFMINIIFQDIAKVIIIFCIFLFQLKLYRAKKYLPVVHLGNEKYQLTSLRVRFL